jgi:hypothetical protein
MFFGGEAGVHQYNFLQILVPLWKHVTVTRKPAHGTEYDGFRHALGGKLTTKTIKWIETMICQGFSAR